MLRVARCLVLAVGVASLLALGCSRSGEPLSPLPNVQQIAGDAASSLAASPMAEVDCRSPGSPSNLFYPLTLGNHWHDHGVQRTTFVLTNEPPGEAVVTESDIQRDLTCTTQRDSRDYTVEASVFDQGDQRTVESILYRQDASGLYEADEVLELPPCAPPPPIQANSLAAPGASDPVARALTQRMAGEPAARAQAMLAAWSSIRDRLEMVRGTVGQASGRHGPRGGPFPGEITRLRYPLHPGAHWVIRESPEFTAVVEGVETSRVGNQRLVAFRIRLGSELFGPNDVVHWWMSRAGQTRLAYHIEADATDESGTVVGRVLTDYDERLVDFKLAKPGPDRTAAPEPVAKASGEE